MLTSGSCLASPPLFFRILSERTAPVRISCSCLSISRSNSSLCLSLDTLSNKVHAPSTRCLNSSSTKLLWLLFVTEPPDWPERWSKFSTALVKTLFLSLLTPGKITSSVHYITCRVPLLKFTHNVATWPDWCQQTTFVLFWITKSNTLKIAEMTS